MHQRGWDLYGVSISPGLWASYRHTQRATVCGWRATADVGKQKVRGSWIKYQCRGEVEWNCCVEGRAAIVCGVPMNRWPPGTLSPPPPLPVIIYRLARHTDGYFVSISEQCWLAFDRTALLKGLFPRCKFPSDWPFKLFGARWNSFYSSSSSPSFFFFFLLRWNVVLKGYRFSLEHWISQEFDIVKRQE